MIKDTHTILPIYYVRSPRSCVNSRELLECLSFCCEDPSESFQDYFHNFHLRPGNKTYFSTSLIFVLIRASLTNKNKQDVRDDARRITEF